MMYVVAAILVLGYFFGDPDWLLSASLATEFAIRSFHAMVFTTIRANNITISPSAFDDCLLTFLFGIEVGSK